MSAARRAPEAPIADQETLARIVSRIDAAEIAEQMVEAFQSRISGYSRLSDPVLGGQILEVARGNVELFVQAVSSGREPNESDLEPFRESARNRATEGMPLEDLLAAYRQGGLLAWQAMREGAEPDEEEAVVLVGELVMRYVDRVSSAVAQTYLDERQVLVSEEERRLRELFDVLVAGRRVDPPLAELAARSGIALAETYSPFALQHLGRSPREHAVIAARLRDDGILALTEGDRVTGLGTAQLDPERMAGAGVVVAFGDLVPRAELAAGLAEVRTLIGVAVDGGKEGVVRPEDYPLELLLAAAPRVTDRIADCVLGPLVSYPESRGADLARTLSVHVREGLDRRAAAKALSVHPNTLDYRLRRITELTGLDLGCPEDLALVVLALRSRARQAGDSVL